MRVPIALVLLILAVSFGACGDQEGASGGAIGSDGCLTADQVRDEVDRLATGIETSSEEVEEKQRQIREVHAQAC